MYSIRVYTGNSYGCMYTLEDNRLSHCICFVRIFFYLSSFILNICLPSIFSCKQINPGIWEEYNVFSYFKFQCLQVCNSFGENNPKKKLDQ